MIFLSESFLDFSIEASDININILGYNSLRSDHPSNAKRGRVCMFYKNYLPVIRRDDLCALSERNVTEIKFGKEFTYFTQFENYSQNFHLKLSNIDDRSPF